jgi:hypothetical protein
MKAVGLTGRVDKTPYRRVSLYVVFYLLLLVLLLLLWWAYHKGCGEYETHMKFLSHNPKERDYFGRRRHTQG